MDSSAIVINIHRVVSSFFIVLAIVLIVRSIKGWRLSKPYTKIDRNVSVSMLVFLYIQLIAGLLLYFSLGSQRADATSMENATRIMSLRFWALEHFIVNMFALFLSQLGWIFILKSKLDINKHKNTLFYFGISILLVIISAGIGLLWK